MNWRAWVAEFFGTFFLVFFIIGATNADAAAHAMGLAAALASGLAAAVMVSVTAPISGGHLNPAVTLGLLAARKVTVMNALAYILFQLGAAAAAAWTVDWAMVPGMYTAGQVAANGTPKLSSGYPPINGYAMEVLLTFFVVLAVYGTTVHHKAPKCGGLFVGLAITVGTLVGSRFTGACMNPARWFGPALAGGLIDKDPLVYIIGPMVGGVAAACLYAYVLDERNAYAD